jgi:flavin reductase (DIM6/NTAB) family NADH-FMN oxidoreductase RutF
MSVENALKKILCSVTVVTTKYHEKVNGASIAWITKLSRNPPLIMCAMAKSRYTFELIQKSKVFAVNILSTEQIAIGKHFGLQSGRNVNKFESIKYDILKTGSPVLKDCAAVLDCKLHGFFEAGDHYIVVGEVVDGISTSKEPLAYNRDDFY